MTSLLRLHTERDIEMPKTPLKVRLRVGRRKLYKYPKECNVILEGNIVLAFYAAIDSGRFKMRTVSDILREASDLWLRENKVTVPPVEAGHVFASPAEKEVKSRTGIAAMPGRE